MNNCRSLMWKLNLVKSKNHKKVQRNDAILVTTTYDKSNNNNSNNHSGNYDNDHNKTHAEVVIAVTKNDMQ